MRFATIYNWQRGPYKLFTLSMVYYSTLPVPILQYLSRMLFPPFEMDALFNNVIELIGCQFSFFLKLCAIYVILQKYIQCVATKQHMFNLDTFSDKSDFLGKIFLHTCLPIPSLYHFVLPLKHTCSPHSDRHECSCEKVCKVLGLLCCGI